MRLRPYTARAHAAGGAPKGSERLKLMALAGLVSMAMLATPVVGQAFSAVAQTEESVANSEDIELVEEVAPVIEAEPAEPESDAEPEVEAAFDGEADVEEDLVGVGDELVVLLGSFSWKVANAADPQTLLGDSEWEVWSEGELIRTVTDCVADTSVECVDEPDLNESEGKLSIGELEVGSYALYQVSVAAGFIPEDAPVEFVISDDDLDPKAPADVLNEPEPAAEIESEQSGQSQDDTTIEDNSKSVEAPTVRKPAARAAAMPLAGDPLTGQYYSNPTDSSNPTTWTGDQTQQNPKQTQFNSFHSQIVEIPGHPGKYQLEATWTRPNASGNFGWVLEYTNAGERWGGTGTNSVPQPDRSMGGQVFVMNSQNGNSWFCTYTSQTDYPTADYGSNPQCKALGGTVLNGYQQTTVTLKVPLSELSQGSDGCPPILGSTGYLRSAVEINNLGLVNWVEPSPLGGAEHASTCADLTVTKTDVNTGEVLSGATFQLWNDVNENSFLDSPDTKIGDAKTTGTNGTVKWESLIPQKDGAGGKYIVEEVSPPTNYQPLNPNWKAITLTNNQHGTLTFENPRKVGSLSIYKALAGDIPADDFEPDDTFKVTATVRQPGQVAYTTKLNLNADGTAQELAGLPFGTTVTFEETDRPAGPVGWEWESATFSPETVTIAANETASVTLTNTYKRSVGSVSIKKVLEGIASTDFPDGTTIPVTVTVTKPGETTGTEQTENLPVDGTPVVLTDLPHGTTVAVTETTPPFTPQGWEFVSVTVTPTSVDVEADVTKEATVTNKYSQILGAVTWNKVNPEGKLLSGSEWELTLPGGDTLSVSELGCTPAHDTIICDVSTSGVFALTGLPWGSYTLRETKPPVGYEASGETYEFEVNAANVDEPIVITGLTDNKIENTQQQAPSLPSTGGVGTEVFLVAALGLFTLSAAAGYVIRRRHQG